MMTDLKKKQLIAYQKLVESLKTIEQMNLLKDYDGLRDRWVKKFLKGGR